MADDYFLAEWLNEQLKIHKLSQGAFAQKAGLSKSVVNRVCTRQVLKPDILTYLAIAKALDVPIVTVLQEAGLVQADPEIPELDIFKHVLRQMNPDQRKMGLALLRTVIESGSQNKGADRG
jgi:transcriptional regulator with XRE-family HTH domain